MVCTGNSCRNQMAQDWARHVMSDLLEPYSAGIEMHGLNPNESCPVFLATTRVVHVGFDDPPKLAKAPASEEEALGNYRRVRDQIKAFVDTLPDGLDS
jgi:arsenate reductase